MNAIVATRLASIVVFLIPGSKISLTETVDFASERCDAICCACHSADSRRTNIDKRSGKMAESPAARNITRQLGIIQLANWAASTPPMGKEESTNATALPRCRAGHVSTTKAEIMLQTP